MPNQMFVDDTKSLTNTQFIRNTVELTNGVIIKFNDKHTYDIDGNITVMNTVSFVRVGAKNHIHIHSATFNIKNVLFGYTKLVNEHNLNS